MKSLVCLSLLAIALTGCAKHQFVEEHEQIQRQEAKDCTLGVKDVRQAVKNNWTYRADIKEDYKVCMSSNSNRDVVYNDTNELAKTCLESAHKLNGGIVPSWSGYHESYLSTIEASLRNCGEID